MSFIIFGTYQSPLGIEEVLIKCPSCETDQWADVMVVGKYYHIFFVPFMPTDKDLNLICNNCGLKRYNLPFDSRMLKNFDEIKGKFKHPWFAYSGIGLIILAIIVVVFRIF